MVPLFADSCAKPQLIWQQNKMEPEIETKTETEILEAGGGREKIFPQMQLQCNFVLVAQCLACRKI